jgi:peptidoglycan/LPS O-acetylase OafA/YrhL
MAVLGVVAFHTRESWFPGGFVGVDIFFVLSGFLITRLLIAEHQQSGAVSFPRFYIRRGLRLLPALLAVCLMVTVADLVLQVPGRNASLFGVLTALTYTSAVVAAGGRDLQDMLPTWSLSVEEYFYFVWPALLVVILRIRRPLVAVVTLCVVAVSYHAIVPAVAGWDKSRIYYAPDTRIDQLFLGALLAFVCPVVAPRVRTWMAVTASALLAAFVVVPERYTAVPYDHGLSTVIALLAGVIIAHAAGGASSWLRRVFCLRPLVWVGKRSYGMYLWNAPLVTLVAMIPVRGLIQLPLTAALIFAVPAASYRFLETRFLRLKRRFAGRSSTPGTRAAADEPAISSDRQPVAQCSAPEQSGE